jgi:hypothetical protein
VRNNRRILIAAESQQVQIIERHINKLGEQTDRHSVLSPDYFPNILALGGIPLWKASPSNHVLQVLLLCMKTATAKSNISESGKRCLCII